MKSVRFFNCKSGCAIIKENLFYNQIEGLSCQH